MRRVTAHHYGVYLPCRDSVGEVDGATSRPCPLSFCLSLSNDAADKLTLKGDADTGDAGEGRGEIGRPYCDPSGGSRRGRELG